MFEFLEIKYLAIKWTDEDTVFKIEESNDTLTIEEDVDHHDGGGGTVQTVTFTNFHHYLGLYFESDIEHPPYFELSNGNREYLISFTSPSNNKTWWIQNSGWDSKNKRYYSELYRTVGKVNLVIQNKKLLIENNDIEFTVAELEHYLSDFKNDLWLLILDSNNPVKANINKEVPNIFHEDILILFKNFIDTSIDLIRNPNMFLSERQNSLPIKKVKPIPRTFRELLENPNRKHAISRDFYESYDTAENRYIYYCVNKVLYLLRRFDQLATSQVSIYQRKIAFEKRWKDDLISKNTKIIDKDVFEGEIKTIQTQLDSLVRQLIGLKININPDDFPEFHSLKYHSFIVRLGGKLDNKNAYFVQELDGVNKKDFEKIYGVTYITFQIEDKYFEDNCFSDLNFNMNFAGFFHIRKNSTFKDPAKYYSNYSFNKITWIDFDDTDVTQYIRLLNKINELKSRKAELENKKWTLPLTSQEKKELLDEAKVIESKVKLFEGVEGQIRTVSAHLPQYISKLKNVSDFFKISKVKKNPNCPNSMVFIQNPIYASCKSLFKQVINLNGLDLSLFDAMIQVDEIGLVNIANLYEKWCLIQTIKVLKSIYGFVLEDDWQVNLIQSFLKKPFNIAIKMKSETTHQSIQLTYEKQLSNGKRPDIVVDLQFNRYNSYYDEVSKQNYLKKINTKTKRLVMDAKFQNLNQSSHDFLIDQLYFPLDETDKSKTKEMRHKNYSEDHSNQVFIIHPKPSVIESPTSTLGWGRYCDYGQSNNVIHRYGGIFLSPSMKYPHTIDNLQRLIGMFIQQNTERHQGRGKSWHNMACISCGNNNRTQLRLTYFKKDKWDLQCLKCSQRTLQSICHNCKNIIFKNGLKWTYHRTRAEDFSNIICPHCESFL